MPRHAGRHTTMSCAKWLNRPRCRLGRGLGWARRTMSLLSPLPNLKFGIFGYPADSAAARDRCLRFLVFLCTRQQLIQQLQRTLKRGNKNKKTC